MAGITITERAAQELSNMLAEASPKEGETVRLVSQPGGGGFAIGLDQVREGDETVEQGGETVLVIGSSLAEVLEGAVIDVRDTDEGPRLTISR